MTDTVPKSRLVAAMKVVGVNLAVLLVLALLAELVFGSLFFGNSYGLLVIDRNVERQFDASKLYGGGLTTYIRDEHGLRGDYKTPDTIDILTMGGSTTNEILLDEAETWSARLAALFGQSGDAFYVVNAGVDGQSTFGHLRVFDLWFPKIPDLAPRYILAFIGVNDTGYVVGSSKKNKWEFMIEPNRKVKQYLANHSALYGLYRTVKGMMRARDAQLVHNPNRDIYDWGRLPKKPNLDEAEKRYASHLNGYEERVHALIDRVERLGAKAIIVTQHHGSYRLVGDELHGQVVKTDRFNPWTNQTIPKGAIDIGAYEPLMVHNRRAMKACRSRDAICIDATDELIFGEGDHYDFLHTTPQGSLKIAQFMYTHLKDKIKPVPSQ